MVHDWAKMGHTVVVIDNDHHQHTTVQGWTRIQLDMRKVIKYAGDSVDLPVPLLPVDRQPVTADVVHDVTLYFRSDFFNSQSITNAKFVNAVVMSSITLIFLHDPQNDGGSIMIGTGMIMM